ncbi:hypothetical protein K2D_06350 [Planctomycetes bacterium K2D]|nr:hypothetical protein K2D_06350 [Planctomycetes bacterium K2D]
MIEKIGGHAGTDSHHRHYPALTEGQLCPSYTAGGLFFDS